MSSASTPCSFLSLLEIHEQISERSLQHQESLLALDRVTSELERRDLLERCFSEAQRLLLQEKPGLVNTCRAELEKRWSAQEEYYPVAHRRISLCFSAVCKSGRGWFQAAS
ncbi:MAG: hypothetical protein HY647_10590 [Acidobacteria bacterium]|nr:hypothetical protein [Acidobacteriota bacterium]